MSSSGLPKNARTSAAIAVPALTRLGVKAATVLMRLWPGRRVMSPELRRRAAPSSGGGIELGTLALLHAARAWCLLVQTDGRGEVTGSRFYDLEVPDAVRDEYRVEAFVDSHERWQPMQRRVVGV